MDMSILRSNMKYGILAGHIAAWSIFGLIFAVDLLMRLEAGTFYSVIGLALGANMPVALYMGFFLHMLTGTVIGLLFGYLTTIIKSFNITSIPKAFGLGILTGILSLLILFLPITVFAVEPALPEISAALGQSGLLEMTPAILTGAIGMHIIYGGILGFMYFLAVVPYPRSKLEEEGKEVTG